MTEHGAPYDVLRYIDFVEDSRRALVVNLNGGLGERRRAAREAEAALRAAEARQQHLVDEVRAHRHLVAAMESFLA